MCQDSWGRSCDDRESFTGLPIPPSPPDTAMISTDSSTVQWYKHNQLPFFYLINGIEKRLKNKKSHCTALLCHEWHPSLADPPRSTQLLGVQVLTSHHKSSRTTLLEQAGEGHRPSARHLQKDVQQVLTHTSKQMFFGCTHEYCKFGCQKMAAVKSIYSYFSLTENPVKPPDCMKALFISDCRLDNFSHTPGA